MNKHGPYTCRAVGCGCQHCGVDGQFWPCDAKQVLDELTQARAALEEISRLDIEYGFNSLQRLRKAVWLAMNTLAATPPGQTGESKSREILRDMTRFGQIVQGSSVPTADTKGQENE